MSVVEGQMRVFAYITFTSLGSNLGAVSRTSGQNLTFLFPMAESQR